MKNNPEINSEHDYCPIRNVLDRFGDKWSLLVLFKLSGDYTLPKDYKLRFNELHKEVAGISQKMLTVTLRVLESDGLIERKVFPEVPPRVEYRLSELGRSLVPLVADLSDWAYKHQDTILSSRAKYLKKIKAA